MKANNSWEEGFALHHFYHPSYAFIRSGLYFFDNALITNYLGRMQSSYSEDNTHQWIRHFAYYGDTLELMYRSSVAHGFGVRAEQKCRRP